MIRRLRAAKRLTSRELAARVNVTGAYVAKLERGVKQNPSRAGLQRIAKALGVSVGELLG